MSNERETKSLAELEADLFLAERAFKRVPSDENQASLTKVQKAFELLQNAKEVIAVFKPVVAKKPAFPKTNSPKATIAKPAPKDLDDSKKKVESENTVDTDQLRLELRNVLLEAGILSNQLVKEYPNECPEVVEKILFLDKRHSEIIAQIKAQNYSTAAQ